MRPNILIVNASIHGGSGNTHKALSELAYHIDANINWLIIHESPSSIYYPELLRQADGIVFGTGTYWDNWSSYLQKLIEDISSLDEGLLFGKSAAIIVTEHSCGGKSVLNRLQGVLSSMGMIIPPMSGLVLSAVGQEAIKNNMPIKDDIWSKSDLPIIANNLVAAAGRTWQWKKWATDCGHTHDVWL